MKFNYFTFMFNYVVKRAFFCCVHCMIQQFSNNCFINSWSRLWDSTRGASGGESCQEVKQFKPLVKITNVTLNRFVEYNQNPIKHGTSECDMNL